MPRIVNCENTIIYKIVSKDLNNNFIYVGQTTNFKNRKYEHKNNLNNPKTSDYKIYKTIRENGGWDNFDMVLVEKYPCQSKLEAHQRERYWYEQLNANMNQIKPFITEIEKKEYQDKYKVEKGDEIKEQRKQFRENNKERLKQIKKEYYEKNKEELKEKMKEYHHKNIDKAKEYKKQKYICDCGSCVSISHKSRHLQSLIHLEFVKSQVI